MITRVLPASFLLLCTFQPACAADKNWSPPTTKICAQQLSDETMKALDLREALANRIPSYDALFAPAR